MDSFERRIRRRRRRLRRLRRKLLREQKAGGYEFQLDSLVGGQAVVSPKEYCGNEVSHDVFGSTESVEGNMSDYVSNQGSVSQEGGGYTFNLDAAKQIGGEPEVVGYNNGSNGCTDMSAKQPPVTGYGSCLSGCDKNPNLVAPLVKNQVGGSVENRQQQYLSIVNIKTGKVHSIFSKTGKKILKKYVKKFSRQFGGEAPVDVDSNNPASVFTPDMTQRKFGCRQPMWEPKCT